VGKVIRQKGRIAAAHGLLSRIRQVVSMCTPHSLLQFSAYVRCGQTAGWIKMPLGMKVGLGPGDFVLDGDPARLKISPPNFLSISIAAKRSPISATVELLLHISRY